MSEIDNQVKQIQEEKKQILGIYKRLEPYLSDVELELLKTSAENSMLLKYLQIDPEKREAPLSGISPCLSVLAIVDISTGDVDCPPYIHGEAVMEKLNMEIGLISSNPDIIETELRVDWNLLEPPVRRVMDAAMKRGNLTEIMGYNNPKGSRTQYLYSIDGIVIISDCTRLKLRTKLYLKDIPVDSVLGARVWDNENIKTGIVVMVREESGVPVISQTTSLNYTAAIIVWSDKSVTTEKISESNLRIRSTGGILYRPHRGLLMDALMESRIFQDMAFMEGFIKRNWREFGKTVQDIRVEKYGTDIGNRTGWKEHIVITDSSVEGFTAGEPKPFKEYSL